MRARDDFFNAPDMTTLGATIEHSEIGERTQLKLRYYLRSHPKATHTFVMFHGNRFPAYRRSWILDGLAHLPYHFVFAEYPGYCQDDTKPSMKLYLRYALDVLDALKESKKLPFLLMGESLGTGVVTFLAAQESVQPFLKKLILQAPYDSISALAQRRFPLFPMLRPFVLDPFPSWYWARSVKCPVLILHGTDDETVPFENGQKLLKQFPEKTKVELVRFQGGHHKDLYIREPKRFWNAIERFLIS